MRIGLVGAFSSGKTTLAKDLYSYFKKDGYHLDINTERDLADILGFNFRDYTEEEQNRYQEELLNVSLNTHKKYNKIITDNPIINSLGYCSDNLSKVILQSAKGLYDILLLCEPVEIEDDGVRHVDEEFRKQVYNKILDGIYKLSGTKLYVYSLSGDRKERLNKALSIIKKIHNTGK